MLPQDTLSGTSLISREQGATRVNGYSLFDCCNVELFFKLAPRRARQIVPIYIVIKYRLRITRLQFYA
jgi:hypothetical protein